MGTIRFSVKGIDFTVESVPDAAALLAVLGVIEAPAEPKSMTPAAPKTPTLTLVDVEPVNASNGHRAMGSELGPNTKWFLEKLALDRQVTQEEIAERGQMTNLRAIGGFMLRIKNDLMRVGKFDREEVIATKITEQGRKFLAGPRFAEAYEVVLGRPLESLVN